MNSEAKAEDELELELELDIELEMVVWPEDPTWGFHGPASVA